MISGAAGDQHAATVSQACFEPGTIKSTYGTGAFLLLNTGSTAVRSENQLITTIAYQLEGKPTYALEGSIFNAGTTVQWLRDELEIIKNSSDIEWLAMQASGDGGLVIVPAFTGLGRRTGRADSLAAMFGLTRDTGRAELARGALEAVVFQTFDLLKAMHADGAPDTTELRVDGVVGNNLFSQMLADIATSMSSAETSETALGAAFLAAIGAGHYRNLDEVKDYWNRTASSLRRWQAIFAIGRSPAGMMPCESSSP
ncbi:MAG: FGGY-family carbohydrate kinase [Thermomicrobiales bacterium]